MTEPSPEEIQRLLSRPREPAPRLLARRAVRSVSWAALAALFAYGTWRLPPLANRADAAPLVSLFYLYPFFLLFTLVFGAFGALESGFALAYGDRRRKVAALSMVVSLAAVAAGLAHWFSG